MVVHVVRSELGEQPYDLVYSYVGDHKNPRGDLMSHCYTCPTKILASQSPDILKRLIGEQLVKELSASSTSGA